MELKGKTVAILATDGFEKSELFEPMNALKDKGATVHIISNKSGSIKSWDNNDWGESVDVNATIENASSSGYNALVLPGGVINPDILRTNSAAINFIKSFDQAGKPIAAICHAPWLLVSAGIAKDKELTSYKSIKDDLVNAGAKWQDSEVVCDNGLVTSRNPDDLPAFISKTIEEIKESKH